MANLQSATNIALWVLFALATVAVALRLTASVKRGGKIFADDWAMLLSWALTLVSCTVSSIAVGKGIGAHVKLLEPESIPDAIYWGLIATNVGLLADVFPKLAVALLVNRLLVQKRWMNIFTLTITIILILIAVILFIISFEQCSPVEHQWNRHAVPGTCWSPYIFQNFAIFAGAYSAAVDLFFSLYPPFVVFRLNMPLKKRLTVMALLSLGLFTFAVTSYKTIDQLPELAHEDIDVTYVIGQIQLWTLIEASVTIIAGSIPTWGWLLRTDGFDRLVTWITMHSMGSNRSQDLRVSSNDDVGKVERGQGSGPVSRGSDKQGLHPAVAQDSVAGIERNAYS